MLGAATAILSSSAQQPSIAFQDYTSSIEITEDGQSEYIQQVASPLTMHTLVAGNASVVMTPFCDFSDFDLLKTLSMPQIEYDGRVVRIKNAIGDKLHLRVRYDDGSQSENRIVLADHHDLSPNMTGSIECYVYDENDVRSETATLDIHAMRMNGGNDVMLNKRGWLAQAYQWNVPYDVERLSVVGSTENAIVNTADMRFIGDMSSLKHLDLCGAVPEENTDINFNGLTRLVSLGLPETGVMNCDWNLDGINLLSAVKWNSNERMPEELFATVGNRNALLYVNDLSLAPDSAVNIVCDGYAAGITLSQSYPFGVIDDFTAGEIVFTKNFGKPTYKGFNNGWETIVLPFDVSRIMQQGENPREIKPFAQIASENSYDAGFWLASPRGNNWIDSDRILKGVPYIISMPNSPEYAEDYNIRGDVAFIGYNVAVNDGMSTLNFTDDDGRNRVFSGSYVPVAASDGVFALTETSGGSVFASGAAAVRPFECWFDGGAGMRRISIGPTTNDVNLLREGEGGVRIWQEGENVIILSSAEMQTCISDMTGSLLRRVSLRAGEPEVVTGLTPGIYIIANRKVLVK